MEVREVEGSGGTVFVSDAGGVFALNHPAFPGSFHRLTRVEPRMDGGYLCIRIPKVNWEDRCDEFYEGLGIDVAQMREFSEGEHRVHRLVCRAFHGDQPRDGMVVDHVNGVTTDNRAANLRWLTNYENVMLGRWRKNGCYHVFGLDTSTGEVTRFANWDVARKAGYVGEGRYEAGGKLMLDPYHLIGDDPVNAYVNTENLIEGYVSVAYTGQAGRMSIEVQS